MPEVMLLAISSPSVYRFPTTGSAWDAVIGRSCQTGAILSCAAWVIAFSRDVVPFSRSGSAGRLGSWPGRSGSAMSARSAPGAVPLSACGSILRNTNAHLRRTVVEMHVDAVPAAARADHGD